MIERMRQIVDAAVAPLRRRLGTMILRAIVNAVDDTQDCQVVQVTHLAGSTLGAVEKFEQYGFTSNPRVGAEGILLSPTGTLDNAILILAQNRATRPTGMQPGESQHWDDSGQHLYFKTGTVAELLANDEIDVNAPLVKLGQNASKGVARLGDQVTITIPTGTFIGAVGPGTGGATALPTTVPLQFTGTITAASGTVEAAD